MVPEEQKERYWTEGYFIVDDLVPPGMFNALLEAAKRVKAKVRSGQVDVFTHWAAPGEPWCIRGLFAPEFGEPIFAKYMLYEPFIDYAHAFLGSELRLGWIDIRTNPHHADFPGGWHRDVGQEGRDVTEEVELEILNRPLTELRWYLALVDDACLQIVPGSHRRYRTAYERECLVNTPHADIPGQKVIKLTAGQVAFWSGKTLHRGVMKRDVERLTLAASWRKHREDDPLEEVDPRFRWRLAKSVRDALPEAMLIYYDRWRALQKV